MTRIAFFRAGEIEACQNAGAPAPIIDYKPNEVAPGNGATSY